MRPGIGCPTDLKHLKVAWPANALPVRGSCIRALGEVRHLGPVECLKVNGDSARARCRQLYCLNFSPSYDRRFTFLKEDMTFGTRADEEIAAMTPIYPKANNFLTSVTCWLADVQLPCSAGRSLPNHAHLGLSEGASDCLSPAFCIVVALFSNLRLC